LALGDRRIQNLDHRFLPPSGRRRRFSLEGVPDSLSFDDNRHTTVCLIEGFGEASTNLTDGVPLHDVHCTPLQVGTGGRIPTASGEYFLSGIRSAKLLEGVLSE